MNQSTVIFGFLTVAFLVFIIQRGELPTYWGFLVKSPQSPSSGPNATANGGVSGSTIANGGTALLQAGSALLGG